MPYPFSSYVPDDMPVSSSDMTNPWLLTPPRSPLDEHDRPYKPIDSDRVSLIMKRKRHRHHHDEDNAVRLRDSGAGRAIQLGRDHDDRGKASDSRVKPSDQNVPVSPARSLALSKSASQESILPTENPSVARSRRWTVTSKSSATQVVTPLRSTVKQSTSRDDRESPAMITLRRATTCRSAKRSEITFFPEPKFGGQKTGLFSYLVSTLTRDDGGDKRSEPLPWSAGLEGSRSHSVCSDGTHPPMTMPAATVYTETTVETSLAMPGFPTKSPGLRRCSTKYMSGGSTYEIIWDENDISSSSRNSTQKSVDDSDRRASLALIRLGARLSRDYTRRSSTQSSIGSSTTSAQSDHMFLDRGMTPERLKQILPRLLHKASLRDLPRSKGSPQIAQGFAHVVSNSSPSRNAIITQTLNVNGGMEFFPPLQSRKNSTIEAKSERSRRATATSITPPSPRQVRFGDLIGSSSHTRRPSSVFTENIQRRAGGPTNLRARFGSDSDASDLWIGESETLPLLRKKSDRYSIQ